MANSNFSLFFLLLSMKEVIVTSKTNTESFDYKSLENFLFSRRRSSSVEKLVPSFLFKIHEFFYVQLFKNFGASLQL